MLVYKESLFSPIDKNKNKHGSLTLFYCISICFSYKRTIIFQMDTRTAFLHETINLFKKWTIVRPSCFAPKKSRPRYISAPKISFAMELAG